MVGQATQAIYSGFFGTQPSKSQRTQIAIIEGAIECFAQEGFEKSTFAKIAKEAKVSRPLVMHYYADKDQLFDDVIKYIRINLQRVAVERMSAAKSFEEMLEKYVSSTFYWVDHFQKHFTVWFLFYHKARHVRAYKNLNTEFVMMGYERIQGILQRGVDEGVLQKKRLAEKAKWIQTVITGALVSYGTEHLPTSKKDFRTSIVEFITSSIK